MTGYASLFGLLVAASVVFFTLRGITLHDIPAWRWAAFAGYVVLVAVVAAGVAEFFLTYPVVAMGLFAAGVGVVALLVRFGGLRVTDAARLYLPRRRRGAVPGRVGGRK